MIDLPDLDALRDEPPGFIVAGLDESHVIPYPAWMVERTTFDVRDEALKSLVQVQAMGIESAAQSPFDAQTKARFLAGQPQYDLGLLDVNDHDYVLSVLLCLIEQKLSQVVH